MKVLRWFIVFGFFTTLVLVFANWFGKIGEFNTVKSIWGGIMKLEYGFSKECVYYIKNETDGKYQGIKYLGTIKDQIAISYSKEMVFIPIEIEKSFCLPKYEVAGDFYDRHVYPDFSEKMLQIMDTDSLFHEEITLITKSIFNNWVNEKNMICFGKRKSYLEIFSWLPWYQKIYMHLRLHPEFIVAFIAVLSLFLLLLQVLRVLKLNQYLLHFMKFTLLFIALKNTVSNPILYEYNYWFTNCFYLISLLLIYVMFQWFYPKVKSLHFMEQEILKFIFIYFFSIAVFIVVLHFLDMLFYDILEINKNTGPSPIWWYATKIESKYVLILSTANLIANLIKHFYLINKSIVKNKLLTLQAEKDQMELASLQARINPHFLYNSLNSIASLSTIDAEKTEKMATLLANFYKYNTNRNTNYSSTIREELDMIESYINIERIRFGDKLNFTQKVDEASLDLTLPSLLLQPLMENAIKYGYNHSSKSIEITLEIKYTNNVLTINLFDSGPPFTQGVNSGFGLQSDMRKLELMFSNKQILQLINEPQKHISITINLK